LKLGTGNSTSIAGRSGVKKTVHDIFIHGWVYNIVNGEIYDLGVSVGPPGKAIPAPPFPAVAKSATLPADVYVT
jgi:carbonic anhydrase